MKRRLIELAAVLAAAAIPYAPTPLIPMVIAASLALWIDSRSWTDVGLQAGSKTPAMIGLGIAIGGLGIAAVALIDRDALSSGLPGVGQSLELAIIATTLVLATSFAAEMTRAFVIAALIELLDNELAAVGAAAVGWAVIFGLSDPVGAIGATAAAAGYGMLYLAAGRRLALPIAAHATFEIGALFIG